MRICAPAGNLSCTATTEWSMICMRTTQYSSHRPIDAWNAGKWNYRNVVIWEQAGMGTQQRYMVAANSSSRVPVRCRLRAGTPRQSLGAAHGYLKTRLPVRLLSSVRHYPTLLPRAAEARMRLLPILNLLLAAAVSAVDYSKYVNPFIGGSGPFPGLACEYPATEMSGGQEC
jgi:hypothetical protein